jgi:hypothetical protein
MKATQRVSALRGGQPDDLIASGAGCEGISLRGASMRRKIGPNRPGIRGISVEYRNPFRSYCGRVVSVHMLCLADCWTQSLKHNYLKSLNSF